MKFYFVTDKYFSDEVELSPRVPVSIQEEEECETKRICVSSSILGALSSASQNLDVGKPTYVYITDVNPNHTLVKQPNVDDVFDVDYTGEFWLTKKTKFKLYKIIEVTQIIQQDMNNADSYICLFKEIFSK